MNKIRQSLALKLSTGILLLTMPVFIISLGILFFRSRHFVRQEALDRAYSVLNSTMQSARSFMSTVETATNANVWLVMSHLQPDSLLTYSNRIVWLNRNVSAYSVAEGDSVITVREGEYDYFEKVWYKTPRILGEACWVDPFDDYNEGTLYNKELIASYCRPLYLDEGKFVGVISTDLSLRQLSGAINASEPPYPHAYFMMIGKEGQYFIHPDSTLLFKKTIFSDADPKQHADLIALGHEMTEGKKGHMRVYLDGEPCLVCYQPVTGTNWSLALVCPDSDILENYHHLAYIILPLLFFGLALILLFSNRVVKRAISPLNRLLEQTQTIANGNYEVYIPRSKRQDAVGLLQNSFATMLQSLNFHMGSIRFTVEHTKHRNEELAKTTRLAEEAIMQKNVFIQNMTHQIRTPLNIIMGFAQVLRDNYKELPEAEIKSIGDMISHSTRSLNRMVLMLFDSSDTGINKELNSYKQEVIPCNEIALESISHTKNHFPNLDVHFETELPDDLSIHSNRYYLMRTIGELLYNAAKYSDGQHVTLRVTQTETTVRFICEDKGPGMAEEHSQLIFDSFAKVNDLSEGLGLGLTLSKRHAKNLGGDLILDTDYQEGCRFIIEHPKN